MRVSRSVPFMYVVFLIFIWSFFILFPFSSFAQQEEAGLSKMEAAGKAVEEGRFEEAIQIYSSILQENPDNFAAQVRLARTYYFAANVNPDYFYEAIAQYHAVIEKWPDFSLPYLHLGQIAYLLGLRGEIEGKVKHARGLYQSALDWLDRYVKLEQREKTVEKEREIIRTRVLEAVIYNRMGDESTASQIIAEAIQDYRKISPQDWGPSPLHDYFVRSSIDYIATKLYDQALVYLEGAWLIQPQPQIEKLFQSITKLKGLEITLKGIPREKIEEKVPPEERVTDEKLQELIEKVQAINTRLENLPSLEEKIEVLRKHLTETLEWRENLDETRKEIQKIKVQFRSLSELKKEIEDIKARLEEKEKLPTQFVSFQERVNLIPQLEEKVEALYQKVEMMPDLQEKTEELERKISDIYTLKIDKAATPDVSELKKRIEEISRQVENFTHFKDDVQDLEQKLQELLETGEKINALEKEITDLDEKIEKIKSAADKARLLSIQLQEIRGVVDELRERISQLEQEVKKIQKEKKEG